MGYFKIYEIEKCINCEKKINEEGSNYASVILWAMLHY